MLSVFWQLPLRRWATSCLPAPVAKPTIWPCASRAIAPALEGSSSPQLAYHGVTQAVAEVSPSLSFGGERPDYVRSIAAPDTYRSSADVAAMLEEQTREAIADLEHAGHGVAAILADTIFSSDGIYTDHGLLARAARAVQAAGGLYIADEVQAGFGTHWGQLLGLPTS